jgi:hypothetical protein
MRVAHFVPQRALLRAQDRNLARERRGALCLRA